MREHMAAAAALIGAGTGSVTAGPPSTGPPVDIATATIDGAFAFGQADE